MPRNIERDAKREQERRKNLIEAGLKLFSSYGIESVKLQDVADEAGVGIATLYNYYQNKVNLVIAISAYVWKKVWDTFRERNNIEERNAYQRLEDYFDLIIYIYKEYPEVLRFSGYYKTYMNMEKAEKGINNEHIRVLTPVSDAFHDMYESAKVDKSMRTDIDEHELFTAVSLTMLGMAERYAQGLVWNGHDDNDYTKELLILKDMMLKWLKGE